jgi:hypothetical protein
MDEHRPYRTRTSVMIEKSNAVRGMLVSEFLDHHAGANSWMTG